MASCACGSLVVLGLKIPHVEAISMFVAIALIQPTLYMCIGGLVDSSNFIILIKNFLHLNCIVFQLMY